MTDKSKIIKAAVKPPASPSIPNNWAASRTDGLCESSVDCVRLYPTLGIAAMKAGKAQAMRLYLLCKYLDPAGRGLLTKDELRHKLTPKYWTSWKEIERLLSSDANGVFWRWGGGCLFLKSPAKVAIALGCGRFRGKVIFIPVERLTNSQLTKATFYEAWHAGRRNTNPIGRESIRSLTGIPERTQRNYEKLIGIKTSPHFAYSDSGTGMSPKELAWQHRHRRPFWLVDRHGHLGSKGAAYLAWQLPNSYVSELTPAPKGRLGKNNRLIAQTGLVTHKRPTYDRRYYPNPKAASKVMNAKKRNTKAYHRITEPQALAQKSIGIWHSL